MSVEEDYPYMTEQAYLARRMRLQASPPAEMSKALDEIANLRRWKAEATAVIAGWDELYEACQIKGTLGMSKSHNLAAYVGHLEGERDRLLRHREALREELAKHGWGDFHYGDQGQDPEVVRVLKETE